MAHRSVQNSFHRLQWTMNARPLVLRYAALCRINQAGAWMIRKDRSDACVTLSGPGTNRGERDTEATSQCRKRNQQESSSDSYSDNIFTPPDMPLLHISSQSIFYQQ
jgi:hypothetical protein